MYCFKELFEKPVVLKALSTARTGSLFKGNALKGYKMRDTSLEAYYKLKESGQLSPSRYDVIRILLEYGDDMTRAEIALYSQITADIKSYQINSITPRVTELIEMGYLVETGTKICSVTKNKAHLLRVVKTLEAVA